MRVPKPHRDSRRRRQRRLAKVQKLEARNLLTAVPLGATPMDTGEFLLGKVAVTPVLLESNGQVDPQTQNWSSAEVDAILAKVTEGVNWWSDTLDALDTVHSLEFVIDTTFAKNQQTNEITTVQTPYEPIDRPSNFFSTYVGDFLTDQGYGDAGTIENAIRLFNHDKRIEHDANWAFTIFVVDSSNDIDGQFAGGGDFTSAFAFAGGQFFVTPSTRPASTIAHEMGHIFWARDEYPGGGSYTDRRGYYNAQNLNAADNPSGGQQPSIMRGGSPLQEAYEGNFSPASTLALIGWRDSDGDGVFDVADVPLQLDAVGSFDAATSKYRLTGSASAVTLANQNSSGFQSDITLNRISEIQYSLDGGNWMTASSPDLQATDIDLEITINESFDTIRWRAIDQRIGVTSNIVEGTRTLPAMAESSLLGLAYLDENSNGTRDLGEEPLGETLVTITTSDGESLPSGAIRASDYSDGEIPSVVDGASVFADGILLAAEIASFEVEHVGNARVFHAYNRQSSRYDYRWSDRAEFAANFETPVSSVEVDLVGIDGGSYGRLEIYDGSGNLIDRVTSGLVADGESQTLTINDPSARIAAIRFFGHARTTVALSAVRFGIESQTTTDANGAWRLPNLPTGSYQVTIQPQKLIHQFATTSFDVQVSGQNGSTISLAASRVDSPRHNTLLPVDVTGEGELTPQDAFVVINDLNRSQARILGQGESSGPSIDVNNDGSVTSLDALMVINALNRQSFGEGERAAGSLVTDAKASSESGADTPTNGTLVDSNAKTTLIAWAPAQAAIDQIHSGHDGPEWHGIGSQSPDSDGLPDWSGRRESVDHETDIEDTASTKADTPKASNLSDSTLPEAESLQNQALSGEIDAIFRFKND